MLHFSAIACIFVFALSGTAAEPTLERFDYSQVHMGAPVRIILYASDAATAKRASDAAFARFAALDLVMSDYNPDSELSRLCQTSGRGEAVAVSGDLWRVLKRAQNISVKTEGAFDVTLGPYIRLWRRARRRKELPSEDRLAEARAAVGWKLMRLDAKKKTVELLAPAMQLDLGGIGMGFAVDEALRVLEKNGVRRALIDASGDLAALDPPPGEKGWKVGILPFEPRKGAPSRNVWLRRNAVTTSGDAFQFVEIDGVRYSHIIDPRSGMPLTNQSTVVVMAHDCTTADALATSLSVLGPRTGLKIIEATRGAAATVLRRDSQGKLKINVSSGFDAASSLANRSIKIDD